MGKKETLTQKLFKFSHALLEAGSSTRGPLFNKLKSGADPLEYSSRYKETVNRFKQSFFIHAR